MGSTWILPVVLLAAVGVGAPPTRSGSDASQSLPPPHPDVAPASFEAPAPSTTLESASGTVQSSRTESSNASAGVLQSPANLHRGHLTSGIPRLDLCPPKSRCVSPLMCESPLYITYEYSGEVLEFKPNKTQNTNFYVNYFTSSSYGLDFHEYDQDYRCGTTKGTRRRVCCKRVKKQTMTGKDAGSGGPHARRPLAIPVKYTESGATKTPQDKGNKMVVQTQPEMKGKDAQHKNKTGDQKMQKNRLTPQPADNGRQKNEQRPQPEDKGKQKDEQRPQSEDKGRQEDEQRPQSEDNGRQGDEQRPQPEDKTKLGSRSEAVPTTQVSFPPCGFSYNAVLSDDEEVINDDRPGSSHYGEHPWQAAIWRIVRNEKHHPEQHLVLTSEFVCSGVLVHPSLVMTAAHCVKDTPVKSLMVHLGDWKLNDNEELFHPLKSGVARIHFHPGFIATNRTNDVVILELVHPVKSSTTPQVTTACIGRKFNYRKFACILTGWQLEKPLEEFDGDAILKEAQVALFDRSCHLVRHPCFQFISDVIIKDEGAPIVCEVPASYVHSGEDQWMGQEWGLRVYRYILVGLVSQGAQMLMGHPTGGWLRISEYRDWIKMVLDGYHPYSAFVTVDGQ